VKHGVTNEEVLSFLQGIRLDSSYSSTQNNVGSIGRLDELELCYMLYASQGKRLLLLGINIDQLKCKYYTYVYEQM